MKAAIVILATGASLAACSSQPDAAPAAAPTTLVTVTRAQQGSAPRLVEAYGTAAPASNGVATLSVPQPGQVAAVPLTPGSSVRAGQPVVVFAVAPSARSSYVQAADALDAAQKQRATTAQLLTQQLATQDQLVQADKTVADAQVALAALRSEGAGASTTTLRAPFAGVVATLPVAPGDRTQPGQALATIGRASAMLVTAGVDPALRPQLREGAAVTLERLNGGSGSLGGHVVRIDAAVNPRTHQIDVDIGYPAGAILSGEPVRASIAIGTASGWRVPHASVVIDADGKAQVFQAANGKAKAVPVSVVASDGHHDTVAGGIDAALPIIVDGAYQVSDGDAIRQGAAK